MWYLRSDLARPCRVISISRLLLLVRRVHDDPPRQARDLVHFLVHREAVDDVLELHRARLLGEDREGVRIPLDQHLALFDLLAVLHPQARAVDHLVALAVAPLRVLHDQRCPCGSSRPAAPDGALRLDDLQVVEPHRAGVPRIERRLVGNARRRAADVERAHRQLRAGLADRLRGDDADREAQFHQLAGREVAAVALALQTPRRDAQVSTERMLTFSMPASWIVDAVSSVDLVVDVDDQLVRERIARSARASRGR